MGSNPASPTQKFEFHETDSVSAVRGLGTIVNVLAVLVGSSLGVLAGSRVPPRIKESVVGGIGIVTVVIGLMDAMRTRDMVVPLVSLAIGGTLGEWFRIEDRLEAFANGVKHRLGRRSDTRFVEGFVTATALYCVGPLTVLGGIQDGTGQLPRLYFIKSALDGTMSIVFGSQFGIGVALSSVSVLVVQGGIAIFGGAIDRVLSDQQTIEMFATGGLMVVAIGLNLLGVTRLRVASYLPGLVIAPVLVAVVGR